MNRFFLHFSLLLILITSISYSLPRFSLKTGGQCIDCHVNPTGGYIRNESGWSYGKNNLSMVRVHKSDDEFELSPLIGKNILFGFDYRTQYLTTERYRIIDFPANSPPETSYTKRSGFQNMTGSVYFNAAASDEINLFARYDFVWQLWEAYAVAHVLPGNGYLKAGTFTPNYGIRIDDHTAYTRGGDLSLLSQSGVKRGLVYSPLYLETGIEIGYYIFDFGLITASVANPRGSLFKTDPAYTARIELVPPISDDFNLMVGGSFATYKEERFDNITFTPFVQGVNMYGGFFGFGFGNFSIMGDYNIAANLPVKDSSASALMIEASYKLMRGLEAVVRYDRFDLNTKIDKNELSRFVIGAEIFPYSFIEIRPQYRINIEEPKIDNNSFVLQFHFWY